MPSASEDSFESVRASLDGMMPDLDGISNELNRMTDSIEKHFKAVASSLLEYPVAASIRETIQSSSWLYEQPPPPPPPRRIVPVGYVEACQRWVSEHRAITAAIVAFAGTGAFIIWRRRRADQAKRRAKRAKNGARTEVVVLAGSPHSPLSKSLSLDLEKRGFIVYIPVSSKLEEQLIQSETRADIRPLRLDITSVSYNPRFPFSNAEFRPTGTIHSLRHPKVDHSPHDSSQTPSTICSAHPQLGILNPHPPNLTSGSANILSSPSRLGRHPQCSSPLSNNHRPRLPTPPDIPEIHPCHTHAIYNPVPSSRITRP